MGSLDRTELQRLASITNGAQSHGPVSAEGKANSSRNSLKHGLTSQTLIIAGESQQEYDELLQDLMRRHRPLTAHARELVVALSEAQWRVRRTQFLEVEILNRLIDQHTSPDLTVYERLAEVFLLPKADVAPYHTIMRYQARYVGEYNRLQRELRQLANSLSEVYMAADEPETAAISQLRNEPEPEPATIPRGAPCPCGSGEKYKRCCGKDAPPVLSHPLYKR